MRCSSWRFYMLTNIVIFIHLLGSYFINCKGMTPSEALRGHLEPLGSHRPQEGDIAVTDVLLEPEDFYEGYVKQGKPLLFKNAARNIPAYKLWNDAYLKKAYSNVIIQIENGKKEDRNGYTDEMDMSTFLDSYKERDIYMVHDVPEEMQGDLSIPKMLLCGGFLQLLDAVVMWFSSGGTHSVLHNDDYDNINCLFDGNKELVMIDKKYSADVEADHFVTERGYSQVDVDKVDFLEFPRFRNLPWWSGKMEAGDCIFIPQFWYHQVNSFGKRNVAVNIWSTHMVFFNKSDCENKDLPQSIKVSDLRLNINKHEDRNTDDATFDVNIWNHFNDNEYITIEDMVKVFLDPTKTGLTGIVKETVIKIHALLDKNNDNKLSWDEVNNADMVKLKTEFPFLFVASNDNHNLKAHEEL